MKLKAALEYEKLRGEGKDLDKIFLHQDGKFYHAYEWSAWLIKAFIENEETEKGLNVSLYKTSNAEYVIGGFPLESLSKYIPEYKETNPIDEKTLSITIELPEDADYETLKEEFEEWRASCPIQESKKLQSKAQIVSDSKSAELGRSGMFAILAQVLAYPLEKSTPIQNVEFISKLKRQVSELL